MVCSKCAHAADNRLPADQHCGQPCTGAGRRCDCAHRVDRYRKPAIGDEAEEVGRG